MSIFSHSIKIPISQRFDEMKSKTSEIIEAFLGTLAFLFVLLPIFLILIPYYVVSSPNHILIFDIGAFRYFGLGPIALGDRKSVV